MLRSGTYLLYIHVAFVDQCVLSRVTVTVEGPSIYQHVLLLHFDPFATLSAAMCACMLHVFRHLGRELMVPAYEAAVW